MVTLSFREETAITNSQGVNKSFQSTTGQFRLLPPLLVRLLVFFIYTYVLSRIGHYWPAAPVARLKNTYHIISSYHLQALPPPGKKLCNAQRPR